MNETSIALRGNRLNLRSLRPDDATPTYIDWLRDPEVMRYLESRFSEQTPEGLASYIETTIADPDTYFLAIILAEGARHIGNIKLGPVERQHRRGDIGLIIGERDCWGKGYATEAISMLSSWAFADLGLHKLTAGAYGTNKGSIRAFIRAGFRVEARRPEHYLSDGAWVDSILLGRIAPKDC